MIVRVAFMALASLMLLGPWPVLVGEIKIGLFADLSGPTAGVGRPYAEGVRDAAKFVNNSGQLGGMRIEPIEADVAAGGQGALAAYTRLTGKDRVVALLSWGASVVESLAEQAAKDQIPTLSASSARLWDPKTAPYSFFASPDFTIRAMAALAYFKKAWTLPRPPRLAMIYPNLPFAMAPIATVREYAVSLGYEMAVEEHVDLRATEAVAQLGRLRDDAPDFIWIGGTSGTEAVILRDAAKLSLAATLLTDVWGSHEQPPQACKQDADGTYSLEAVALYGQDVPGMKAIAASTGGAPQPSHYVRGFTAMLVLAEAVKIAKAAGPVTGRSLKDALEKLRGFDPLGLSPPVTFTPEEHRGCLAVMLYRYQDGKPVLAAVAKMPQ